MTDIRDGSVKGDAVADVNVEAVVTVRLVDAVSICHWEWFPLLTITCVRQIFFD